MTIPQRRLGQFTVSAIGYGAMPISMSNGTVPPRDQGIQTVHSALDAGITLIDTADIYAPSWDSMGHNELYVAEALGSWTGDRSRIVVATKAGITRAEGEAWGRDGSRDYLRGRVEASLKNLGVDKLDLLYLHRPDRAMLYVEVIENLAALKQEGLIAEIGVSNANVEEIRIAIDVLGESGLAAVQNEFSPKFNHTSIDELRLCARVGAAFLPWSPLGGTGGDAKKLGEQYPAIAEVAKAHEVSPQQVTLAWELALGEHVIPIPGASRPQSILDSAQAMTLQLTAEEIEALSASLL